MEKDKVDATLMALYAGAIQGIGFDDVTAHRMEMPKRDFGWTLYILQMRGWIAGCVFQPPSPGNPERLLGVNRVGLQLTPGGFQRAEAMAAAASEEKDNTIPALLYGAFRVLRDIGCGMMASVIYDWIA